MATPSSGVSAMGDLEAPQAAVIYLRGRSWYSMSQLQACLKAARPRVAGHLLGPVQRRQSPCPHLLLPGMAAEVPVIQDAGQLGRRGSRSEAAVAASWLLYSRNWMEI